MDEVDKAELRAKGLLIPMKNCPTVGCNQHHAVSHVMCKRCWAYVTAESRSRVWRAFRTAPLGEDHMAAVKTARTEAQRAFDIATSREPGA